MRFFPWTSAAGGATYVDSAWSSVEKGDYVLSSADRIGTSYSGNSQRLRVLDACPVGVGSYIAFEYNPATDRDGSIGIGNESYDWTVVNLEVGREANSWGMATHTYDYGLEAGTIQSPIKDPDGTTFTPFADLEVGVVYFDEPTKGLYFGRVVGAVIEWIRPKNGLVSDPTTLTNPFFFATGTTFHFGVSMVGVGTGGLAWRTLPVGEAPAL